MGLPIYEGESGTSLTSLCELCPVQCRVWSCSRCSHLQGMSLPDVEAYYDVDYRILLDEEEEDQIYEVGNGQIIYRTEHQVKILLDKLDLPSGAKILDYGCAKASTLRKLKKTRSDIQVHLFDVSRMYVNYWEQFVEPGFYATYTTPPHWASRFDFVTSFFALEHISQLLDTAGRISKLLKHDGVFYGVVPDVFGNLADFVVVDHVNHFTVASLQWLLEKCGFIDIEIDRDSHRGALVFVCRKGRAEQSTQDVSEINAASLRVAKYWRNLNAALIQAENKNGSADVAIYGSGFYGAYIANALKHYERVICFVDASPYQQGKMLYGKPIVSPSQLPASVRLLYIGLNPAVARQIVSQMKWLESRNITPLFLSTN